MEHRRDPVVGLSRVLQSAYILAEEYAPHARLTFGDIKIEPGSRNTVPGSVTLAIDLRYPDPLVLDEMDQELKTIVDDQCRTARLAGKLEEVWHMPPVSFAPECITAIKNAVEELGVSAMDIVSGAGHDALYLSKVTPTGMIFIPCRGGLSHNEREYASPEDLISGGDVLLRAILQIADS